MIVMGSILFWGCMGFFIPRKYLRIYLILASIGLSFLYFFFQPPVSYDLYRHYEVLHIIRKHDIWTVMSGALNKNSLMIETFQQGAPMYLLYAYLISLLQIDQLLPVITGIIIYTSASNIILMAAEDIDEEIADWKISFCFFFVLVLLDFRTVSGIRYMMSYALFAYILYKDLVRNANSLLCLIAYFAIANIHNSIFILIIIRLLIELNRFIPKPVLMVVLLASFSFVDLVLSLLVRYTNIPMIQALVDKINIYGYGGGTAYIVFRAVIRFIHITVCLLLYLYCKKNIQRTIRFQRYGDMLLFFTMFAFGAIRQYDTFVRSKIFICLAALPFLLLFLRYIVEETPLQLVFLNSSLTVFCGVVLYFMIYVAMALSVYMYYFGYYRPMDYGILLGLRRFGLL